MRLGIIPTSCTTWAGSILTTVTSPGGQELHSGCDQPAFSGHRLLPWLRLCKQGDLRLSGKWLKKATEVTPRDTRVQYQLGMIYRKARARSGGQEGVRVFRRNCASAMTTRPHPVEVRAEADQGHAKTPTAVCEQLYDPDNADKLTELGTLYGQHGDPAAALKPLQRAAELSRSPRKRSTTSPMLTFN